MLEISKVSYSYGGNSVFSDVSLNVAPGSFYFLTGPSGSGKTTFINLCAGALIPEIGSINVFGKDTQTMTSYDLSKMRQRLGIVHQNCEFLDHLSIEENIALPLSVAGLDSIKERTNIFELMKWVGLHSKSKFKPEELSGGERQRAALARAVIMSPEIILADEPTGNVDWEMSQRLLTLLLELNKMGKTIFISTHDLSLVRLAKSKVKARTLRISFGANVALMMVMKGLPLAYSKDMQEDKQQVFDAADNLVIATAAMTGMINDLRANRENMEAAAHFGFSTATDLADWLVQKLNLPFREAHHITGQIVLIAEDRKCDLSDLGLDAMKKVDDRINDDIFSVLSVQNSVSSRSSYGGTAPSQVRKQINRWREILKS